MVPFVEDVPYNLFAAVPDTVPVHKDVSLPTFAISDVVLEFLRQKPPIGKTASLPSLSVIVYVMFSADVTSSTKGTITSTQRRWGANVRCVKFTEVDAE